MSEMTGEWRAPGLREVDEPVYRALMDGDIDSFNRMMLEVDYIDLTHANLVAVDFRGVKDIRKLRLSGARLRQADLRGLDLSKNNLDGCSINGARISGTRFPSSISAEEIRLALEFGTRLRHKPRSS